jgi:hypothetical protein
VGWGRTGETGAVFVLHRAMGSSDCESSLAMKSNRDVVTGSLTLAQSDDDSTTSNIDARAYEGIDSVGPGQHQGGIDVVQRAGIESRASAWVSGPVPPDGGDDESNGEEAHSGIVKDAHGEKCRRVRSPSSAERTSRDGGGVAGREMGSPGSPSRSWASGRRRPCPDLPDSGIVSAFRSRAFRPSRVLHRTDGSVERRTE